MSSGSHSAMPRLVNDDGVESHLGESHCSRSPYPGTGAGDDRGQRPDEGEVTALRAVAVDGDRPPGEGGVAQPTQRPGNTFHGRVRQHGPVEERIGDNEDGHHDEAERHSRDQSNGNLY